MARDPVCGMQVDEASAAASLVHEGERLLISSAHCKTKFKADPDAFLKPAMAAAPATAKGKDLAKDPICGMMVDKATALKSERAGRSYYFCSVGCQRTFEQPEAELKSMRTRVAIALTGVLALAILRAGAFIALATGATIVTWRRSRRCPGSPGACGCSCW